jgi:hypothetical protein
MDPSLRDIIGLAITPANPTITVTSGMAAAQAFELVGMRRDGSTVMITSGLWTLGDDRLGVLANTGIFTSNGITAGATTVTATATGAGGTTLTAMTNLTVRVMRDASPMGTPADAATHFTLPAMMDPARAPAIVYPLDDVLMPANVSPPDIQWSQMGAMGDLYRVQITKPHVAVTAYVLHTGGSFHFDLLAPRDAWRSIAESDPDSVATLTLDRWDSRANQVVSGGSVRMRFVRGSLFGTIYYWNLDVGRLVRIDAVTSANSVVIPNPPAAPTDASNHCVACHTVSRDGRYLSAEMWGGSDPGAVYDLTRDLTVNPAPTEFPVSASTVWLFSSWNPDSTRLMTNPDSRFVLLDPRTGMSVAATGLPAARAAHPEWSPDGANVAFINNIDVGTWAVDFSAGDLTLLPAGAGDTFAAPHLLHHGADLASAPEGGAADTHPTWSPDSHWVAFAHGTHSRSLTRDAAMNPVLQGGALYLISRDGGAPARLNHANGGATATDTFWPTFSPFTTADRAGSSYIWLAFYSRRGYGNALAGTAGTGRRQLWVTAINTATPSGMDPSNVPYWLPGQDSHSDNMAAYWAPSPCRMNGSTCTSSTDCCSGRCNAMGHCEPPPPAECHQEGATCSSNSDCCAGLTCYGNVCQAPPG